MANNENRDPAFNCESKGRFRYQGQPSPPTSADVWQKISNLPLPPIPILAPSKNPLQSHQRDNLSHERANSPLKIRKTRENLRQANTLPIAAPSPCLQQLQKSPGQAATQYVTVVGTPSKKGRVPSDEAAHMPKLPVVSTRDQTPLAEPIPDKRTAAEPPVPKQLGQDVISRVKKGISQRSKSSQSIRKAAIEPETNLFRRFSSKRKQSREAQSHQQSQELGPSTTASAGNGDAGANVVQRSLTGCTVRIREVVKSDEYASGSSKRDSRTHDDCAGDNATPPPLDLPSTAHTMDSDRSWHAGQVLTVPPCCVPYVDLKIFTSRVSVDVALQRDVWIAAEATVSTKNLETSNAPSSSTTSAQVPGIDTVVLLSPPASPSAARVAWRFIGELALRLNSSADRLAVLSIITQPLQYGYEWLHPLQNPDVSLIDFLSLHNPTSESSSALPDSCLQPTLYDVLRSLRRQGLHDLACQYFVISDSPSTLTRYLLTITDVTAHEISIGARSGGQSNDEIDALKGWALELNSLHDFDRELLDSFVYNVRQRVQLGIVTSLRICYKPLEHCRIMEVVGQKALKGLRPGQRCCLLFKMHVPRMQLLHQGSGRGQPPTPDALIAELESIVGTLETNVLHIEARYRHSMLPLDNFVTVRQIVSVRRLRADSRWSIMGSTAADDHASPLRVYYRLAQQVANHQPPARALRLMDRWIPPPYASCDAVTGVRRYLEAITTTTTTTLARGDETQQSGCGDEAPLTDDRKKQQRQQPPSDTVPGADASTRDDSAKAQRRISPLAPSDDAVKKTTTTIATSILARSPPRRAPEGAEYHERSSGSGSGGVDGNSSRFPSTFGSRAHPPSPCRLLPHGEDDNDHDHDHDSSSRQDAPDAARQLWRHIRRTSRSAHPVLPLSADHGQQQQEVRRRLASTTTTPAAAAADEAVLRERRNRALANKRSIGAETLRDWRWEEHRAVSGGEAPWL